MLKKDGEGKHFIQRKFKESSKWKKKVCDKLNVCRKSRKQIVAFSGNKEGWVEK